MAPRKSVLNVVVGICQDYPYLKNVIGVQQMLTMGGKGEVVNMKQDRV